MIPLLFSSYSPIAYRSPENFLLGQKVEFWCWTLVQLQFELSCRKKTKFADFVIHMAEQIQTHLAVQGPGGCCFPCVRRQEGCQARPGHFYFLFSSDLPIEITIFCILYRTNTWSSRTRWVNIIPQAAIVDSLMKVSVAPDTVFCKQPFFFGNDHYQVSKPMAPTEVRHRWLCRLVRPWKLKHTDTCSQQAEETRNQHMQQSTYNLIQRDSNIPRRAMALTCK